MSSFIRYKFASSTTIDTIQCEGPSMPVWEFRDEVIAAKRLGRLIDCDIHLFDEQTKEEFLDDNYCIPRNSFVIVKRLPKAINVNSGSMKNMNMLRTRNQDYAQMQPYGAQAPPVIPSEENRPILQFGTTGMESEVLIGIIYLDGRGRGTVAGDVQGHFGPLF